MTQGVSVKVFTGSGRLVGVFVNPKVDMDPAHHYEISGMFVDGDGNPIDKVEFNPQALPYTVDISAIKKCDHGTVHNGYIQRGRQPVRITGSCKGT